MRDRGIFKFGNYSWLGEYRANSILSALKKLGAQLQVDPVLALDTFHSCYLLNTKYVEKPDRTIVELTRPVLQDEELRKITVVDDLVSRVFAVKYLFTLQKQIEQQKEKAEKQGNQGLSELLGNLLKAASGDAGASQKLGEMIEGDSKELQEFKKAVEKAKKEAKKHAENAKAYYGLKAGVGHSVTFGELLELDFTVDIKELLKLFRDISIELSKAKVSSAFGSYEGIKFGRDLTKLTPTALMLDDDLFWYRFATSTLPQVDTKAVSLEEFILLVDKSGSMKTRNKTLWSRAVALTLAKMAKSGGINAKLAFFDSEPFPQQPLDLSAQFDRALEHILRIQCEGGTSIDRALKYADKENVKIILITDGEDEVHYRPRNRLISVMVEGDNSTLKEVSDDYLKVQPTKEGALRLFEMIG